jgi:hypothetical protein
MKHVQERRWKPSILSRAAHSRGIHPGESKDEQATKCGRGGIEELWMGRKKTNFSMTTTEMEWTGGDF